MRMMYFLKDKGRREVCQTFDSLFWQNVLQMHYIKERNETLITISLFEKKNQDDVRNKGQ